VTEFIVQQGDVLEVSSDLLLLKHAQSFYGADKAVARRLLSQGLCTEDGIRPEPGGFVVVETKGSIAPKRVMFLGTPPLGGFTYDAMQVFARSAIEKVAELGLLVRTISTTVHGAGYGLDGGESLQRLVLGFREGLSRYDGPVERIIFLTLDERAERMLATVLREMSVARGNGSVTPASSPPVWAVRGAEARGGSSTPLPPVRRAEPDEPVPDKRHVFVAMPYSEEFENVYEFGIYPAVRNCNFICERVDETHFVGDVLGRIRDGIEAASLVIADLSEGRPNVYLEVGYAWGKGVPVIFVARKGEKLHFDVSTHRCIFYGKFTQFAKDLEELIRGIGASSKT
jgi:hypothetical protein